MELLQFILSDFWVWAGFICLATVALAALSTVVDGLAKLVKACKRNRKVTSYRIGERWHVTIENASKDEAQNALISASLPRTEEVDAGRDDQ